MDVVRDRRQPDDSESRKELVAFGGLRRIQSADGSQRAERARDLVTLAARPRRFEAKVELPPCRIGIAEPQERDP